MTLDEIHGLLLGQECEHRSALCAQCIAAAMRQIETWEARAELVREQDECALRFVRDSGAKLRARIAELERQRDEWRDAWAAIARVAREVSR